MCLIACAISPIGIMNMCLICSVTQVFDEMVIRRMNEEESEQDEHEKNH